MNISLIFKNNSRCKVGKILSDFLILTPSGLYCIYGDFYIDPKIPVGCALISHAHADHACSGNQLVYCTAATQVIMASRYGNKASAKFISKDFYQQFSIKDIQVTFFSAGHILGSAQILMIYKGVKYLYTGDYKMQEDATCEPIDYVKADVLITESTFANPTIEHPDFEDEIKQLNNTRYNILLGAYALGKAQRVNYLINIHCPHKVVLLHHSILPIHRIYEQFGISNLFYWPYDKKILKKQSNQEFVYIVPPLTFNSSFGRGEMIRVFASGWEYLQRNNNMSLYISDHVDWKDILKYIQHVEPQEIWTIHGDGDQLEEYYKGIINVKKLS